MCRSTKTLRTPYTDTVTDDDMRAAALQYVRKISGFRQPSPHSAETIDRAVAASAVLGEVAGAADGEVD